jgi:hypothetical protein
VLLRRLQGEGASGRVGRRVTSSDPTNKAPPRGIRSADSSVAIRSARTSLRRGERPTIGSDEAPERRALTSP